MSESSGAGFSLFYLPHSHLQYCSQRRRPAHWNARNLDNHPTDASVSSIFPSGLQEATDPAVSACSCRLTSYGNSTGSSRACSFCFSHPSSSGSLSIQQSSGSFCGPAATAASAFYQVPVDEVPNSPSSVSPSSKPCGAQPPKYPPEPVLGLGDAEYLAAVRCVVIPVLNEFKPEIVLVSAGFDAAHGHPEQLGGYSVSPGTFAWITRQVS